MSESIHVGMSKIYVAKPPDKLICLGLGSCVAVVLWDPKTKIGGIAHVMLPNNRSARKDIKHPPGKFGNTAVATLLDMMLKEGANCFFVVAKLAGGSNMFSQISPNMGDIGGQNVKSIKEALKEQRVRIVAEDVGGSSGRSIELDTQTGKLVIRSVHLGRRML